VRENWHRRVDAGRVHYDDTAMGCVPSLASDVVNEVLAVITVDNALAAMFPSRCVPRVVTTEHTIPDPERALLCHFARGKPSRSPSMIARSIASISATTRALAAWPRRLCASRSSRAGHQRSISAGLTVSTPCELVASCQHVARSLASRVAGCCSTCPSRRHALSKHSLPAWKSGRSRAAAAVSSPRARTSG